MRTLIVVIAAVSAISVVSGFSRTSQQPQQPVFHAEANYVRVDVYPTLHGAPVMDLKRDDFEVFDDGVPQSVVAFEHIDIRGNVAQELRRDPNNVADMRRQMADPNSRLFGLFLDITHVSVAESHAIRLPLTHLLDRLIGQDDLFGVMTPRMSATDVAFSRRTNAIDTYLTKYWDWGESGSIVYKDPVEEMYTMCYPGIIVEQCQASADGTKTQTLSDAGIALEMIARRREAMALDSIEDLIHFLGGVREERSAVLLVSPGWNLFRPDSALARPLHCNEAPGRPNVGIDPRNGKLTSSPPIASGTANEMQQCERERLSLAQLDDERRFRQIPDEANRANVSFYAIDPGGLRAGTSSAENRGIENRLDSLRVLANDTDGAAVVNTNDLDTGLKKMSADLSSYYLLGYYSSNMKNDGKFHSIKVRVKRAGVDVRNRRGYLAPRQDEINAGKAAAAAPMPAAAAAESKAMADVLAPLASFTRDAAMRLQLVAGWTPSSVGRIWAVGELSVTEETMTAGDADVTLTDSQGVTVATAKAHMDPRVRSFKVALIPTQPLRPGEYTVRATARRDAGIAPPVNEVARITFPIAPDTNGAVFIRRGPSTANKELPTADLRLHRSDQLRIEIPTAASDTPSARLLDRTGKTLAIPVTTALRDEADGSRWQTAQLALAPLGVGNYIVEFTDTAGQKRTMVAFSVIQ